MSQRKMELLLVVLVFECSSLVQSEGNVDLSTPVSVQRRQSSDVYYYNNGSNHKVCDNDNFINVTYLVSERRCVTNEDLFSACSAAVIPAGPSTNLTDTTYLDSVTMSKVINLKEDSRITSFKFSMTDQSVNSSFCLITSLEVYRGRKEAFQISHDGFSLSINGTVDIIKDELDYGTDELKGELYRMNLSCSGDRLPNSGCIFFKVLGRISITTARFNCTVPGTVADFTEECNITTRGNTIISTTSDLAMATSVPTGFEYGSAYFFVVIGCGVLVVAFVVAICVVCLFVCLFRTLHRSKTQSVCLTEEKQLELQSQDSKAVNVYNTQVSPDRITVINEGDGETHTYALLEKQQSQQSTDDSPQLYEVPKKTIHKPKKQINGGTEQQGISNVLFHQYDDPVKDCLNKLPRLKGNFGPSEHTYTLPVTQKITNTVNQYDEPLMESTCTPCSTEGRADPSIHKYAVLENQNHE